MFFLCMIKLYNVFLDTNFVWVYVKYKYIQYKRKIALIIWW